MDLGTPGAEAVAQLAYQNVARGLVWQCTNRAAHGYRWGQLDVVPVLALVESMRLVPGPAGVGVEAKDEGLARAALARVGGSESLTAKLRAAVGDGWVRQWDGGSVTWARAGHELPPTPEGRLLHWCDATIGARDVPVWHPHRDTAAQAVRLRTLAEQLDRSEDFEQAEPWANQLAGDPAALDRWFNQQQNAEATRLAEVSHWLGTMGLDEVDQTD